MSKFNKIMFGLVAVFTIVIAGFLMPKLIIRDASLEAEEIICAKRDAYFFFDNPFDRLLIIETAVVRKEGDVVHINIYTFGGLKYAEAEIICNKEARVVWRRWFGIPEKACTMEAKICPDGSAVGRVPPDCEFAPCPAEKDICEDRCGDGICQEIVCMAIGCPCPETPETCPEDCKQTSYIFNKSKFCPDYGDCHDYGLESRKCDKIGDCIASCAYGCVSKKWMKGRIDCEAIWENFECECIDDICQRK